MFWFMASLTQSLQPSAIVLLHPFFFCTNDGIGILVRNQLGYFVVICLVIAIFLEGWTTYFVIACLRRCRVSKDLSYASRLYRASLHMYMRLCIFTVMQLFPILLTAIDYRPSPHPLPTLIPREVTEIMESMYPLAVFFVFGTQSAVLRAWKILPQTSQVDEQA
ncbi:hypothetical protein JB92DRAFT_2899213 [Gautieria morchelliformis]|nr:hypothetical protein JB92DRAFT_2899213 [Gautieria morchelliformis]